MAIEGMDVGEVNRIGNQLRHEGDAIRQVMSQVDSLISQAESVWKGPDATQFNEWWRTQHRPALSIAADAVTGLGQSALNNASAQTTASNQ